MKTQLRARLRARPAGSPARCGCCPATALAEDRVALLFPRAQALAATGQFTDSHAALLESLALVPEQATATRARLTAACAAVEHLLGDHEQAHARLAGALNDLANAASPEAAALMIELAGDAIFRLQYETAQDWGRRALTAARPIGDRPLTAAALAVLARSLAWGGAVESGETVRAEAAALIDSLSDDELARRLDAAVNLAGSEIYLDRFLEASAHAERAVTVGRATGQGQLFPGVFATLGVAWCAIGRLTEAAELLDAAIEAARLSGNTQALAWVLFCRSFVAVPSGDAEIAVAAAQESLDLTRDVGESVIAARAALMLAVALLQTGQPARAAEVLASSAGGEEVTLVPDVWRAYGLDLMTTCWIELGRRPEARACCRRRTSQRHSSRSAPADRNGSARGRHRRARRGRSAERRRKRARIRRSRRRGRRSRVGGSRPDPRWSRPRADGRTRPGRNRTGDRRRRAATVRRGAIPRRRRTRAPPPRAAHPPAHATRQGRRDRHRVAHRARASDLAPGRRP